MTAITLIWVVLIALEIARNWYIIQWRQRRPTYWKSTVGRIIIGGTFWIVTPCIWPQMTRWQWYGLIPMMGTSFWYLFDYGLNLARRLFPGKTGYRIRPIWYLNPNGSLLDQLQCKYPHAYAWFWWKLFLMTGGFSLFHYGLNAIWEGV